MNEQTKQVEKKTETTYPRLDGNIVRACCVCHPGYEAYKVNPAWKGLRISHGYCPTHLQQFRAQFL